MSQDKNCMYKEMSMKDFVSEQSKELWNIFKATGNICVYMLYSAVQHTPDKVLEQWENYDNAKEQGIGQ